MAIIGFNLDKINVEKKDTTTGKVNVKNNVSIKDITEANLSIGSDNQKALNFKFAFASEYEPNVATISLEGSVLFLESKETSDIILKDWQSQKRVKKDLMSAIINNILSNCNVEALILSQKEYCLLLQTLSLS
jgi:hypothetical protein